VAVLGLNSAAHLVAWLAVPRSGRVLNDLNYRLAPAELEFIAADCDARALLVDDAYLDAGLALAAASPSLEHVVHTGAGEAPSGTLAFDDLSAGAGMPARPPDAESIAGIFYTGGTTGRPKGVMLSHANLVANAKHVLIALPSTDGERYLHAAPMFHLADGSSTLSLTWTGSCHVMLPAFDPGAWLETVSRERVTRTLLVPTMVNMVVNHPDVDRYDLSCLRMIVYGASPMPEAVLRSAMETFACEWAQGYGMTEAAPLVTLLTPEGHRRGLADERPFAARLRSAGRAVVGVEVEVHRADGSRADVDEPGEVWVRGPNVMTGYWRREAETAAALDMDGWYHSGDAGYLDADGYLFIVDRVKDMIISGGENVYSAEVENAICDHPAVLECAVFGVPDDAWGERVHAVVVPKPGRTIDEASLLEHCHTRLAGYKCPRSTEIREEPLPKSGAGKILKRDLREPYWADHRRRVS
jgi:long-chain acyl-CoA synthetase